MTWWINYLKHTELVLILMDIFCTQRQNTSYCFKLSISFKSNHKFLATPFAPDEGFKRKPRTAWNSKYALLGENMVELCVPWFFLLSLHFLFVSLGLKSPKAASLAQCACRPPSWFTVGLWDYSVHSLLRTVISVVSNSSLNPLTGCVI